MAAPRARVCSVEFCLGKQSEQNPFVRIPGNSAVDRAKVENKSEKKKQKLLAVDACRARQLDILWPNCSLELRAAAVQDGRRLEVCRSHYDSKFLRDTGKYVHLDHSAVPYTYDEAQAARAKRLQHEADSLVGDSRRIHIRRRLDSARAGADDAEEIRRQLEASEADRVRLAIELDELRQQYESERQSRQTCEQSLQEARAKFNALRQRLTASVPMITMQWVLSATDERVQHFTGFRTRAALLVCAPLRQNIGIRSNENVNHHQPLIMPNHCL